VGLNVLWILTVAPALSARTSVALKSQIRAILRPAAPELSVWSTMLVTLSAGVSLVLSPNLTPSQAVDQNVFVTPTAKLDTFAKISDALKSQIHATRHHAVQELRAWLITLEIPSAGVSLVLYQNQTPSPAVDQNVFVTLIAKQDMFARTRSALKNQTHATHRLVVLEPPAWSTTSETLSADASLD